jgi:UDP-glucuronate 4-epimerase
MGASTGVVLVTGAAGFIGSHVSRRLLDRGDTVLGLDNLNDYYDVRLKEARLARLSSHPQFQFVKLDLSDRARYGGALRDSIHSARGASGGAGRCPVFTGQSACLHGEQRRRVLEHSRRLSASQGRALGLCLHEFGVRRPHEDAVLGARQCRSSRVALRRDQEGERAHGALLCAPVSVPDYGITVLYRLRALGPSGYGVVSLYEGDSGRQTHRRVQSREDAAGLYLCRRYRRRVLRTLDRPAQADPAWASDNPDPGSSSAPYRCTTSAITSRSSCCDLSRCWNRRWA